MPTHGKGLQSISGALTEIQKIINNPDRITIPRTEAIARLQDKYGALMFSKKFEDKGFTGFKPGDKVAGRFIIQDFHDIDGRLDKTKICLLVDLNDMRSSDSFIVSVTEAEYEMAMVHKGLPLEGVVTVTSERRNTRGFALRISDMDEYDAKIEALEANSPVNPRDVESLERGQPVVVEGELVDYQITERDEGVQNVNGKNVKNRPRSAAMRIKTSTGDFQIVYWNATHCHGMFCDVGMGLAIWPWALVLRSGTKWFWIGAVINILILYFLFSALQKWLQKPKF